MFEVEQKYRVDDPDELHRRLMQLDAKAQKSQRHSDSYYNHPSRDFAETGEAFRVRRVDGVPMITYKGPKLPGPIKARKELEWRLDPGDPSGEQMEELLQILGFRSVATVEKTRSPYLLSAPTGEMVVVIDEVETVGIFAEIEQVVAADTEINRAKIGIDQLSDRLRLRIVEPRSYLEMVLESISVDR